jgi:cell wall-associated NlpC family hydrolase
MNTRTGRTGWHWRAVGVLLALALLAGCAGEPPRPEPPSDKAIKVRDTAVRMLGKPYRYGGYSPKGFDCSGLVYYSYGRAGIKVPRSTEGQLKVARVIGIKDLRLGDLLFFDEDGKRSSHVAIYVGDDTFVHAPSSGKRVRTDHLHDPYWRGHFASARRLPGI